MLQFSIITITSFVTLLDTLTIVIGGGLFNRDKVKRLIPVFSIIYGVALGIAGFYTDNVEMGSNIIEAIFIGISAGAAATGIDQVEKQLTKPTNPSVVELGNEFDMASFIQDQLETIEEEEDEVDDEINEETNEKEICEEEINDEVEDDDHTYEV